MPARNLHVLEAAMALFQFSMTCTETHRLSHNFSFSDSAATLDLEDIEAQRPEIRPEGTPDNSPAFPTPGRVRAW